MKIKKIEKIKTSNNVYNLHIEDNHNYFANDVCVSNCHGLKSDIIRSVAENVVNCKYRLGFTGTMPENMADRLLIEGVLGPVIDQALYDELQKEKTISPLNINIIKLLFSEERLKLMEEADYVLEKQFIEEHEFRNKIICQIASKCVDTQKNCLIIVKKIEHGELLTKKLIEKGIKTDFICGDVKIDERNDVRHEIEDATGRVIVATVGVFSTGISINRLHVLIFASAGKSKIQTLQSVGRGLRKHTTKTHLSLFDIGENLKFSNDHLKKRIKYYDNNKFVYNIREIKVPL